VSLLSDFVDGGRNLWFDGFLEELDGVVDCNEGPGSPNTCGAMDEDWSVEILEESLLFVEINEVDEAEDRLGLFWDVAVWPACVLEVADGSCLVLFADLKRGDADSVGDSCTQVLDLEASKVEDLSFSRREILVSLLCSILLEFCDHHNYRSLLLPNHHPEILNCVFGWGLGGDVFVLGIFCMDEICVYIILLGVDDSDSGLLVRQDVRISVLSHIILE